MTPAERDEIEAAAVNLGRWLAVQARDRSTRGERCGRLELWLAWSEDGSGVVQIRAGGGSRGQAGDWRTLRLGGAAESP